MPKVDLGFFDTPYIALDASQVGVDRGKNGKLAKFVLRLHAKQASVLMREVPSLTAVRHLQALGMDFVSIESRGPVADMKRENAHVTVG
jgi:putative N-acetylmannosamine-6-phosphate epimerase